MEVTRNTLTNWLISFSSLHARAMQGTLTPGERTEYVGARKELAEALLTGQRMSFDGGARQQRTSLRVAQALPLELEMPAARLSAVTLDVSVGGFSTLVSDAPELGTLIGFKLKLGRHLEPIAGSAKVTNVVPQKGSVRLGLMFDELSLPDRDRLEMAIADIILSGFGWRSVEGT